MLVKKHLHLLKYLHSTIFILKLPKSSITLTILSVFTFYNIYIKPFYFLQVQHCWFYLHSTIFILKPKIEFLLLWIFSNLHSTIFILKPTSCQTQRDVLEFTFYNIYIKTNNLFCFMFLPIIIYILQYLY